ncbi:hypothetical protein Patl1_07145 [Pistacia atlantica]|uniref:Uncharacterized protein n=1 Tax=Pistacia atlantica TaxID=434234 RepID=A0ACC1AIF3_9ROSI|nr:hypothetical protein Patl1_07145 [Pistacia atlantica]
MIIFQVRNHDLTKSCKIKKCGVHFFSQQSALKAVEESRSRRFFIYDDEEKQEESISKTLKFQNFINGESSSRCGVPPVNVKEVEELNPIRNESSSFALFDLNELPQDSYGPTMAVQKLEGEKTNIYECKDVLLGFMQHLPGSGWNVVASIFGTFPKWIKQLPLDRQPQCEEDCVRSSRLSTISHISEKGMRSLIKGVLELAKEPSRLFVEEVHCVLVDIISASANATPGLGRYQRDAWLFIIMSHDPCVCNLSSNCWSAKWWKFEINEGEIWLSRERSESSASKTASPEGEMSLLVAATL